ncbi:MAG: helix-turn-helix transcriptional regulator [Verrucomicrobiota bacterium]
MARTPAENRKLKQLGDNVRRERVRIGLTQEQLAEKTDLNPRTIQKIEAGDIKILVLTLVKIQAALGCSWLALLGPDVKRREMPLWTLKK